MAKGSKRQSDRGDLLVALFEAGVAAVGAGRCLPPHLPPPPAGRLIVIGAGKAAAVMAAVTERHYRGQLPDNRISGLVVVPDGHQCQPGPTRVEVVTAGHPRPDARSTEAARRMLATVEGLSPRDMVICLISGGGSALLALPAPGITLETKLTLVDRLMRAGAGISEINCLRKHLSAIKGGRLGRACAPAGVVTLVISDVPGDNAAEVASGPTIGGPASAADARRLLARHGITPPPEVARHLDTESRVPPDATPGRGRWAIVATADDALEAIVAAAADAGYQPLNLGGAVEGEAAALARDHAILATNLARQPGRRAIISGGEATVATGTATGTGTGTGGPNLEYLLALAIRLDGQAGIWALAGDSDGADGSLPASGAVIGPDSLTRAAALGLDPAALLGRHDSHRFFAALGDLVTTGPTLTNVNDLRIILVEGDGRGPTGGAGQFSPSPDFM